jgi:hypothetical protein
MDFFRLSKKDLITPPFFYRTRQDSTDGLVFLGVRGAPILLSFLYAN